jgi:hypothetical protein
MTCCTNACLCAHALFSDVLQCMRSLLRRIPAMYRLETAHRKLRYVSFLLSHVLIKISVSHNNMVTTLDCEHSSKQRRWQDSAPLERVFVPYPCLAALPEAWRVLTAPPLWPRSACCAGAPLPPVPQPPHFDRRISCQQRQAAGPRAPRSSAEQV